MAWAVLGVALLLSSSQPIDAFEVKGHMSQGGWLIGRTEPGATILFAGNAVKVGEDGLFLLGFGRDEAETVQITEALPDGSRHQHRMSITQREYEVQTISGLPESKVTPDPELVARIQSEQQLVQAARSHVTDDRYFLEEFRWPVLGPVTGVYGSARILNGKPRQPHYGVDVAADEGAPVVAPASGIVRLAEKDLYLTGGTVILDHGYGVSSTFLHLSRVAVKSGDIIKSGDPIGRVGKTGRATGAHLDWRLNWGQVRLDPQFAVPSMPVPEGGWKEHAPIAD